MQNTTIAKCFVLLITLCFLTGCSSAISKPSSDITAGITTSISSVAETSMTSTLLPVGITYSVDQKGRTFVTGATPEGIPVSAVILANRDLQDPGEASSYEIKIIPYDETDREVFVGQDWTLLESSTDDQFYAGTIYYDMYRDTQNKQWNLSVLPMNLVLYSVNGKVLNSFLYFRSEQPEEQEDLSFSSSAEVYQEAQDFFSNAGFSISDCYDIITYPSTWLETNSKLARVYGEDMTEYDRLYPDGLLPENGAYLLNLRRDIYGLPMLTGEIGRLLVDGQVPLEIDMENSIDSMIQAIVTNQGIEFVLILSDFVVGDVIQTGEMISFEDALHTVSQNFFSGNPNDGLYQLIYQNCMQDFSANMEETITPVITESYRPVSGTVSIEKAELGLLPLVKGEDGTGRAIPCWEFLFVWQSDPNDPQSAKSECWVAVNALTGEYIPATTCWGGI